MNTLDTQYNESRTQELINTLTTSTKEGMLLAAISTNAVSDNRQVSVATANDLPDLFLTRIPDGTIVFVEAINMHVIANTERWMSLDGRVYRNDAPSRTVWSWGCAGSGQLGDDTIVDKSSPVSVVGGFTDWCQVSAGCNHSAAVRMNGTLWGWGSDINGKLGDNNSVSTSSPVSVVGGFTDWCQVSAGMPHSAAVRTNGTIWSWGSGADGRLGDNTLVTRSSPVSVVGGFTDWCQVSAGGFHTAAVRTNGTVWSWGNNTSGRLGDNTATDKSSPVSVVGGFTDWCQVSVGYEHSTAIRTNGTIWSWGLGSSGRLGDNTNVTRSSPVSVVGGFTDWCQVSVGVCHTAAVRTNGTIWSWGNGCFGILGDNTITTRSSPVSVVGGFTDWCQVSAGRCHTAAVRTNGTIWTWGNNSSGRLGNGTVTTSSSPVSTVSGFTDWCQVGAGGFHSVALRVTDI
jgi:alpha-tubulin suppressor-like RCC1 family protein